MGLSHSQPGCTVPLQDCSANKVFGTVERNLTENEVHVWSINVDQLAKYRGWTDLLNEEETRRAACFRFQKDRQAFIVCRGALRILIASYLASVPKKLRFIFSERGKPELHESDNPGHVHFNVSHSDTRAVLAFVRNRKVGIDLERIRTDCEVEQIADRFFSAVEKKALLSLKSLQRHKAFFNLWTRKEAFLKARGGGLSIPLSDFDVSLEPVKPQILLATRPDANDVNRWHIESLQVAKGFAAALALEKLPGQKTHVDVRVLELPMVTRGAFAVAVDAIPLEMQIQHEPRTRASRNSASAGLATQGERP
jgi:4'-phosphopantetheinyl transferase